MKAKALIILNPCSGKKLGLKYIVSICEMFEDAGYQLSLHLTEKSHDATQFVLDYGKGAELIVCIGGDGTLNEVIYGIMLLGVSCPIGYIPLGSTNDFASGLNIPKKWKAAVNAVIQGTPHKLDICKFNERYFSYIASCGAFAKTSYSTPQNLKNSLGHLAYLLEGVKDISTIKPLHLSLLADGEKLDGDYILAACSNAKSVGGVLKLDPSRVDLNDGKMELMLIPTPKNAVHFAKILQCLQSKQYIAPYVIFKSCSEVEIQTDASFDWSLDGEHCPACKEISVSVIPSAISLMLM
ncbi:MAG: YegS/Rv2252/BmrU family lipid kinase [Clostridia bacterium]|nr:YegS/Rv2252/BmrU family lipid kinase [Clostridia bacterium]